MKAAKEAYAVLKQDEGVYWNYTIWAPLSMSALFYSSTMLTEWISARKYPYVSPSLSFSSSSHTNAIWSFSALSFLFLTRQPLQAIPASRWHVLASHHHCQGLVARSQPFPEQG